MKNAFLIIVAVAALLFLASCSINTSSAEYKAFVVDWAEGACSQNSDCTAIEYGCGGGHIECTNETEKWKNAISTCEIVKNHPSQQGYACGCIIQEHRCGWLRH